MKENIEELVGEKSDLTSSDSKSSSWNSHFQFHIKPTSFDTDHEDYIKIPAVTTPIGMVLQQVFE